MSRFPKKLKSLSKSDKEIASKCNKLWKIVSEYVRRRDGRCITCGKCLHWKELQCGHAIHGYLDFCEYNLGAQCATCNFQGSGVNAPGMPVEFKKHLEKEYGIGIWTFLQNLANTEKMSSFKWRRYAGMELTPELLNRLIEYYQSKLDRL